MPSVNQPKDDFLTNVGRSIVNTCQPATMQVYTIIGLTIRYKKIGEKMAVIEKFLGQRVEIPEDRKYYAKQGLWAKPEDNGTVFGFTEPALVLAGGLNDLDWLVGENESVRQGQDVVFVITGKILYIDTPLPGIISFNPQVKQNLSLALKNPYEKGWLFKIKPDAGMSEAGQTAMDAQGYAECLKGTDGLKNPEGIKGGVSGICKAVYSGISGQKI
jgi:glycine cleavage system H lipoate-binding protein